MMDRAVTLLPQPLSPTNATVRPRGMVNEMLSTATEGDVCCGELKVIRRLEISSRGLEFWADIELKIVARPVGSSRFDSGGKAPVLS